MFSFHLLIYICLPPLWLQIPIRAQQQGDSTFSIIVSRDGAWDTAKRSTRVHGATSVRTHFKAYCCQLGGEKWGWSSLWAARGLLPWMFCFVPATFSKLLSHHTDLTLLPHTSVFSSQSILLVFALLLESRFYSTGQLSIIKRVNACCSN